MCNQRVETTSENLDLSSFNGNQSHNYRQGTTGDLQNIVKKSAQSIAK